METYLWCKAIEKGNKRVSLKSNLFDYFSLQSSSSSQDKNEEELVVVKNKCDGSPRQFDVVLFGATGFTGICGIFIGYCHLVYYDCMLLNT